MEFIKKDVFGDKSFFKKKYINPTEEGKFSNSSKQDKEDYLKVLAVSFLINVVTTPVLFSFHAD